VLPGVAPAMLAGAGLAFARAIGEFGSVVLISSNLPFKTEVSSSWIYSLSQSGQLSAAAAVSVLLVAIALVVLLAIGYLRRRFDVESI
jgi:sulfate/thiosulfate transport system permease protein